MPAQESVRRHERLQIPEDLSTEGLGFRGQASTLGIGEPETARTELLSEDAILFLEIVDDVTLLLVDPPSERDDEKLDGLRKRQHVGERSRGDHERRRLVRFRRRIGPSDGVDRIIGPYDVNLALMFRGTIRSDWKNARRRNLAVWMYEVV